MNILLVTTEVEPFAKSGGLADVTSYLTKEWDDQGHNPIIVMPKYGFIDFQKYNINPSFVTLAVPMGLIEEYATFWIGTLPGSKVPVYFIEHNDYFNRTGIYGDSFEYSDNDRRFIFLARAIFELAKAIDFTPDIIHAHDYHTAFAMPFLKIYYKNQKRFAKTAGVFTIHNLAYQGKFNPFKSMELSGFGMKEFYPGSWFEKDGEVNFMKIGIMFADKITTVSPTYSQEIRMAYYSEGLQQTLLERSPDLIGVLNGVYYSDWNPETDNLITQNYSANNLKSKLENKYKLLEKFGLNKEVDDFDIPLVGMVTRLTEQKGLDIIKYKLEQFVAKNKVRFCLLGSGDTFYIDLFRYLQSKYPKNILVHIGYNNELSHKIYAASDFFLVPSRFEPCGLTQMYALKYASIPIVRATGGLADTIFEYDNVSKKGNGFVFLHYNSDDFEFALNRALELYKDKKGFEQVRKNAMEADYSSSKSASNYIQIFNWALEKV